MSRIGKTNPVGKAKVAIKDRHVSVEGPKGKLEIDASADHALESKTAMSS